MSSFIVAGDNAKDYPTRLKSLEVRIKVIAWVLVVPGIIDLFVRAHLKRKRKRIVAATLRESQP